MPLTQRGFVYILTNRRDGTLYTGVTTGRSRRMEQHKTSKRAFTHDYNLDQLVLVERHDSIVSAIQRKKNIKHRPRAWNIALIERTNPEWLDLTTTRTEND